MTDITDIKWRLSLMRELLTSVQGLMRPAEYLRRQEEDPSATYGTPSARHIGWAIAELDELDVQLEALAEDISDFQRRPDPIAEALNSGDGTYRP